jgi:hypothetical protein
MYHIGDSCLRPSTQTCSPLTQMSGAIPEKQAALLHLSHKQSSPKKVDNCSSTAEGTLKSPAKCCPAASTTLHMCLFHHPATRRFHTNCPPRPPRAQINTYTFATYKPQCNCCRSIPLRSYHHMLALSGTNTALQAKPHTVVPTNQSQRCSSVQLVVYKCHSTALQAAPSVPTAYSVTVRRLARCPCGLR